MKMTSKIIGKILKTTAIFALLFAMTLSAVSCSNPVFVSDNDRIAALEQSLKDTQDKVAQLEEQLKETETKVNNHQYDFYITLGTLPTLYATLNAYQNQNPNTYMWFLRGNTISYEYSADFIHYFPTQSKTNASSVIDHSVIRNKVSEILAEDPEAKFHLYCDDLRAHFILNIFVQAGVNFNDMQVTLLSDGTGTYANFEMLNSSLQLDGIDYNTAGELWNSRLDQMVNAVKNGTEGELYSDTENIAPFQYLAFYLTTLPNVEMWVQHPDYLVNADDTVMQAKSSMKLVAKDPAKMYRDLDRTAFYEYQKAVLANALVGSTTLESLEDAVAYFNGTLDRSDKEVVLILGTNRQTLDENKSYIDQTVNFYTPTRKNDTTVTYKGVDYSVEAGVDTLTVDGYTLTIGEIGAYLNFKGHPAYPVNEETQAYFAQFGIEILPHRTPVEVLFWMYDVKAGGYESTSFLSCNKGQTEFFFENVTNQALIQMKDAGFFDGAVVFTAN